MMKKIGIIIFLAPSFVIGMDDEIELKRFKLGGCVRRLNKEQKGPDVKVRKYCGPKSLFQRILQQDEYSFKVSHDWNLQQQYLEVRKKDTTLFELIDKPGTLKQYFFLVKYGKVCGVVTRKDAYIYFNIFRNFRTNGEQCCSVGCNHRNFWFSNDRFIPTIRNMASNGREILFECDDGTDYIMPESELSKIVNIPGGDGPEG